MKSPLVLIPVFVLILLAATITITLPPPYATPSVENRPVVISQPKGASLKVPQGFTVSVWAQGFQRPRFMLLGSSGEIFLADSGPEAEAAAVGKLSGRGSTGTVYVFANGDPSKKKRLIEKLDRPYGLAQWKNYLYVAESDSIKRYPYDSGRLTAGPGEEIVSLKGYTNGHWTRSLLFDRGGQKLYVGVGSESNDSTGEPPMRAAINRFNPDGSGPELFATGTRNPIGLHWYPGTDVLWAAVQERDGLGDDLPPDYLTHIQQGAFYGWPYAYFGPNEDPRHKGERLDLVRKTVVPDLPIGAHVAVLDYTFYTANQFPAEYYGGAFLADHGSWNRSKRVGYSVVFVPFQNGQPTGPPRDFVTGWMLSPDRKEVWGRPVAVMQMQDGSLLISEDGGNKLWRVSYKSGS
jgi:glucose/arabinose dehydrogenase